MNYFKINYSKLQNLKQIKYFYFIIFILLSLAILIIIAFRLNIEHKLNFYGIYKNNLLNIKVNTKLSDTLRQNNKLEFNGKKVDYEINSFEDYEIINDEVYQNITLDINEEFIDNEIGIVTIYYNKQKLIKFIFELFK